MKQKVSITIDEDLLSYIEAVAKKQGINRSQYIEKVVGSQMKQLPLVILTSEAKVGGKEKSLLSYKGKALLDSQIEYALSEGFTDIWVATNSKNIKKFLDEREGVQVFFEKEKWGSAGTLKAMAEHFGRRFIFMYCDILLELNLHELVQFHVRQKSGLTLVLKSMKETSKYGTAVMEGSKIERFEEKSKKVHSHLAFIGLGVIDPLVGKKLKKGKFELQLNDVENKYGYIYERSWKSFEQNKDFVN